MEKMEKADIRAQKRLFPKKNRANLENEESSKSASVDEGDPLPIKTRKTAIKVQKKSDQSSEGNKGTTFTDASSSCRVNP